MSEPVHNTAHVDEIATLLIEQFKNDPGMVGFAQIFGAKIQEIEDALWQLYTLRGIDTAFGVGLDNLGSIVGYIRGGLSDDDYRAHLRAEILLNISSSTVQQILDILYAAYPDSTFTLSEHFPADFTVLATSVLTNPTEAGSFVTKAKPAGVGGYLVYSPVPLTSTFTYCDSNTTQPVISTLLGYADSASPGTGGHYAGSA